MSNFEVNGNGFDSYSEAVRTAKEANVPVLVVYPDGTKREVWKPIPKSTKRRVRHVLVNADGSETEFSKVRR